MRVKQFASWMLAVLLLAGSAMLPAGADAPASAPIPVEFVSTNSTRDATHTFVDDAIDYSAQGVAKPEGGARAHICHGQSC